MAPVSSPVIMVSDLWPTCHEFESSTSEDPPGLMHIKSNEAQSHPVVMMWKFRDRALLRCRPHYLTMVQNYEFRFQ
ncbi:hypothetical protein TNCV_2069211 [Trichonephila clavipes]|uniref:Uncharacterized protein n=1 Tax=Trichonephila clavipes TaxID=2585209 RepID=A0A8X7BCY4_TRICX|nr:hypothetical protein TNCV_2069211 [Trichonephila clavipes]